MGIASMLALSVALVGCGGGGGGGSSSAASQPAPSLAAVANAGSGQNVTTGAVVSLDGSKSTDANGEVLTYKWTLLSKPAGSTAVLSSASTVKPTFTADVSGTYVVQLVVSDSKVSSAAVSVSIGAFAASGYAKLDAAGLPLPDSATSWSCVRDNASKLVWEVKTKDGGLRDWGNAYTNYDDGTIAQYWNGSAYVKPSAAVLNAADNSAGFRNTVNGEGLCGAKDWRVPSRSELLGLVNLGFTQLINTDYFPDVDGSVATSRYIFWSSTSDASVGYAGLVRYSNAYGVTTVNATDIAPRYNKQGVRLVRTDM